MALNKARPYQLHRFLAPIMVLPILLDDEEKPVNWIRIYPIRFRQLDFDQRYPRWSILSAKIEKNNKDYRLESYRIDDSSIKLIRAIDTQNKWQERKAFILPLQFNSISDIKAQNRSLGLIKPQSINNYFCKPTERNWNLKQQAVLDQLDLF